VHSQSGGYGIRAAIARPDLVKAVVSVEPRSCAADDAQIRDALGCGDDLTAGDSRGSRSVIQD